MIYLDVITNVLFKLFLNVHTYNSPYALANYQTIPQRNWSQQLYYLVSSTVHLTLSI